MKATSAPSRRSISVAVGYFDAFQKWGVRKACSGGQHQASPGGIFRARIFADQFHVGGSALSAAADSPPKPSAAKLIFVPRGHWSPPWLLRRSTNAAISERRHVVVRGPSFTGRGNRPFLTPAHQLDRDIGSRWRTSGRRMRRSVSASRGLVRTGLRRHSRQWRLY